MDSLPQPLLEGRPAGSLLVTPQQLQQLQRLHAGEQAGGALTLTLQQGGGGVAPQLVLAPQGFLSGSGQPTEHILHTSQQIGHTSIQHVLQSSISHVRQASILQSSLHQIPVSHASQVSGGGCMEKTGSPLSVGTPSSPFSPRSLTPSPSPTQQQHRVTPQPPQQQIIQQHPTVLQLFHQQATRNTLSTSSGTVKGKQPPQILPKPPGSSGGSTQTAPPKQQPSQPPPAHTQQQPQGTLLFNQMVPNGAVLVQQQTSSGVQFILKSPSTAPQPKPGLVLANGGLQPQAVIVQGRTQAHQVVRLVPGQMQLQQIQTSGPTFIAVPSPAAQRTTPPPPPAPAAIAIKKLKKKKKEKEEPRLDLANLIKISGIDEEDVSPVISHNHSQITQSTQVNKTPPRTASPKQPLVQQQLHQQNQQQSHHHKQHQLNTSQLLAQLQSPAQVGTGLRLSVGEDGTMVVHQADQQSTVTPSIAAAAQSQLAQLIAEHGGQVLQTNSSGLSNSTSKETSFMQSLQTAVLHLSGSAPTDGVVVKGNIGSSPVIVNNTAAAAGVRRTSGVVVTPQNGVRLVADLNGLPTSLTEHNRLIVSGIATPGLLEQNRVQIVAGVPTSTALSLEQQQNRIIVSTPNTMLTQQGRVLVSTGSLEHQNRLQIVTSNSSALSLTEQNRVIVSNVPSNVSVEQQNRLQILSGIPSSNVSLTEQNRLQIVSGMQNSLTEQQNRVILSGVQNSSMSLEQQNRVQIVSGGHAAGPMALEQNRVEIMSGVQSSLTEQQNRVQIVSGVPNSNTLSLSEQNRVFLSSIPNANTLSLSEKQNLVQIVNSNISLAEEQNRLQILSTVPNPPLSEQSRLQIVNSIPNSNSLSLSEQNRVLVTNVPTSNSFSYADTNHVQIITTVPSSISEPSRIHLSPVQNSSSIGLSEQSRVQIVTSVRNSLSLGDSNRLQVVTSLPTTNTHQEPQNKVQVVSNSVTSSNIVKDQRPKCISTNFREDQGNVQIVSALVNNEKSPSPNESAVRNCDGAGNIKFQHYIKPTERRIITSNTLKDKDFIRTEEKEEKKVTSSSDHIVGCERLQFSSDDPKVQLVTANNHTCVVSQSNHIRTHSYPQESKSPAHYVSSSPISSPPSTPFNNRPNLTVVTQPHRNQPEHAVVNSVQASVTSSNVVSPHINASKTEASSLLSKTSQANRRTYDNAFLDSIAQSHPSLVINKSPSMPPCAKLMKTKKPIKKAALVKPMMAEDRGPTEKEEPPNLVPINVTNDHTVVSRVQTIQLTPQKQQVSSNTNASSVRLVPVTTNTRGCSTQEQQTSPTQPPPSTHANKATSPIPIQQASTQTPAPLLPPPPPLFSRSKRASMIEQQMQADRQGALNPDCKTPFLSKSDAVKRLIRYHTLNEPVLSEKDLAKADELFEQTAKHLLDKKNHLYNKYTFLILKESMRMQQTSELILLERLFVADETARLEQIKQEANAPASSSSSSSVSKRERDDSESSESKKHCPDDEEINAQVQSAIDSILNLQRNDPLEEAVRSISS